MRRTQALFAVAGSAAAVVVLVYLAVNWATHSPRFAIEDAEVNGADNVPAGQLERVLGAVRGSNLLRVELAAVERELEALPWIETAEVSRKLPDRLIVNVVEHEAKALLSLGGLYLADAQGQAFKRATIEVGEGDGLPVITGLDRDDYGRDRQAAEAAIRRAIALLSLYQQVEGRPAVGEINVNAAFGYALVTTDSGARLVVGHGTDKVIGARFGRFDLAWSSLSDTERESARTFYLDNTTRTQSVTVALKQ